MSKHDWIAAWEEGVAQMAPDTKPKIPSDFYSSEEMRSKGVVCGDNCMLHKTTILVNPKGLRLGNNVRIDGFCTISTGIGIDIGNNVHIAGYVTLMGGAGIRVGNYASIASGAKVYSVSDDVMGRGLVGPCVLLELRHLHKGMVMIGEHAVLAINSVMMPYSSLPDKSTLMPFSVLSNKKDVAPVQFIYEGVPAKPTKVKFGIDELIKKLDE